MTESYRPEPEQPQGAQNTAPEYPAYSAPQGYPSQPQYGEQQNGYGQPSQYGYQPEFQPYPVQPLAPSFGQQYVDQRKTQAESYKNTAMIMAIIGFFFAPIPCGPLAWWFGHKSIESGGDAKVWKIIGIVETFLPIVFVIGMFAFAAWATSVGLN